MLLSKVGRGEEILVLLIGVPASQVGGVSLLIPGLCVEQTFGLSYLLASNCLLVACLDDLFSSLLDLS